MKVLRVQSGNSQVHSKERLSTRAARMACGKERSLVEKGAGLEACGAAM